MAGAVVAGRGDRRQRAVVERQQRGAGVGITRLGEEPLALVAADGVHRRHLGARDETDDVEVVDVAVAEDAAAGGQVVRRGRRLVVGGRADRVDEPQLARADCLPRAQVAGVEAPLEPHLHRHPAPSTASTSSIVSSSVTATGFSQNVGTPAATASRSIAACELVSVAITIASTSPSRVGTSAATP